uniref:CS domain-containing protein n=1 Tax=Ditylenchus dipsaci TaxID=166011 RepID=A0A915EME0_9BILA
MLHHVQRLLLKYLKKAYSRHQMTKEANYAAKLMKEIDDSGKPISEHLLDSLLKKFLRLAVDPVGPIKKFDKKTICAHANKAVSQEAQAIIDRHMEAIIDELNVRIRDEKGSARKIMKAFNDEIQTDSSAEGLLKGSTDKKKADVSADGLLKGAKHKESQFVESSNENAKDVDDLSNDYNLEKDCSAAGTVNGDKNLKQTSFPRVLDETQNIVDVTYAIPGIDIDSSKVDAKFESNSYTVRGQTIAGKTFVISEKFLKGEIKPEKSRFVVETDSLTILLWKKIKGKNSNQINFDE